MWVAITAVIVLVGSLPRASTSYFSMQPLDLLDLGLENNRFSGCIPEWFGLLWALRLLHLANNAMVGSFPHAMSSLSSVHGLYLLNNEFSGSLPRAMSSWSSMGSFYLKLNKLNGNLPRAIGSMSKTHTLVCGRQSFWWPYS